MDTSTNMIRVKLLGEVPLKQIITEQNHAEVVEILISLNESRTHRCEEYVKEILPKSYKNEEPKKRFLDMTGGLADVFSLVSVNKNGEIICMRPDVIKWGISLMIEAYGFDEIIDRAVMYWNTSPEMVTVNKTKIICEVYVELLSERTKNYIGTESAVRTLGLERFTYLYEALNGNRD